MKVFVAHKGLPLVRFDAAHNRPDDIVAVSRQFPDMQFVVFHGAVGQEPCRRARTTRTRRIGIDTFLRALDVHGVPPNSNVWVDVGTVWREVLRNPTTAAHTLGKLLKRVGEHRVLWGTDAIWYGSPQAQLQAFRAFTISNEFQDRFGYPALTATVKDASARAQRRAALRPRRARDPLRARERSAHHGAGRPPRTSATNGVLPAASRPNGPTTRREMLQWLAAPATRWTPL